MEKKLADTLIEKTLSTVTYLLSKKANMPTM